MKTGRSANYDGSWQPPQPGLIEVWCMAVTRLHTCRRSLQYMTRGSSRCHTTWHTLRSESVARLAFRPCILYANAKPAAKRGPVARCVFHRTFALFEGKARDLPAPFVAAPSTTHTTNHHRRSLLTPLPGWRIHQGSSVGPRSHR